MENWILPIGPLQFKGGIDNFGKIFVKVVRIWGVITGVALMSFEAASKVAYWDIRLPKRPPSPTEMRPNVGQGFAVKRFSLKNINVCILYFEPWVNI